MGKSLFSSKTLIVAAATFLAGGLMALTNSDLGLSASFMGVVVMVKSALDAFLRFVTTEPIDVG